MIGSPAAGGQTTPSNPPADPSQTVLGETAPGSASPFTLKQIQADKDFHIVTSDGLKITAQQATQLPIDNRAIAVTGGTGATITLPDGKQFTMKPNARVPLNELVYNPKPKGAQDEASTRLCTVCGDGLRRNVGVHIGNPRMLRTYVDQAIAGYSNCTLKASGDCTAGDLLVRTLRNGCDGFDTEDPYHACIDRALGPPPSPQFPR